MNGRWTRRLQFVAACVAIPAYAGISHYCNTGRGFAGVGAAVALAPAALGATLAAWRWLAPAAAVLITMTIAGLIIGFWPVWKVNYATIAMIQETGIYALLGVSFGRTLCGRARPMCTVLADRIHGPLNAAEEHYTRRVTQAWTIFFFSLALVSVVLFASEPLRVWSFYSNFCTLPLVGAMFLAELAVRRRALPRTAGAGLAETVRAFRATSES